MLKAWSWDTYSLQSGCMEDDSRASIVPVSRECIQLEMLSDAKLSMEQDGITNSKACFWYDLNVKLKDSAGSI